MRPRLVIVFVLVLATPIVALGVLGARMVRDEREVLRVRYEELAQRELAGIDATVRRAVDAWGADVLKALDLPSFEPERLRDLAATDRMIRQVFVLAADGKLEFPPAAAAERTADEEEFLVRTKTMRDDRETFWRPAEQAKGTGIGLADLLGTRTRGAPAAEPAAAATDTGWYAWYWGSGLNLVRWKREPSGRVVAAEIDRMAFLADVISSLPPTDPADPATPRACFRLADANGAPVYEWGLGEPAEGEKPRFARELSAPLGSWRIEQFPAGDDIAAAPGGGLLLGLLSGLGALVLVVAGLGAYFIRESGRDIREAQRRVSFVNQVSHELKTPLTNIRMYAELLEESLDDGDEASRGRVQVIVEESRRLSRLIANVLSFARQGRGKLSVRPLPGVVDDVVAQVIDQFRPALASRGVEVAFAPGAPGTVRVDADALGQILGNLLGNIEKYAAGGGHAGIASRREGDTTIVEVADRGPGIPSWAHRKVFEPFWRLSNAVTDGVAGTGIGLSIARDLARLHGGDLALVPAPQGTRFRLALRTPAVRAGEEGA